MNQETADAILDLAKLSIMAYQGKWDEWTCDFGAFEKGLNSLVVEDVPSIELLHLRDIKQMIIQLQQFQDSRYSALLSAIATNRPKEV
jgi:hypothetical protein